MKLPKLTFSVSSYRFSCTAMCVSTTDGTYCSFVHPNQSSSHWRCHTGILRCSIVRRCPDILSDFVADKYVASRFRNPKTMFIHDISIQYSIAHKKNRPGFRKLTSIPNKFHI